MALISLCFLLLAQSASLPKHPDVEAAKTAYKARHYKKAARAFLELVQRWPEEAALYRALARTRVYAEDHRGAVLAYRFYLQLLPEAGDKEKIQAELEMAQKRAGAGAIAPPARARKQIKRAKAGAKAGKFIGAQGAFTALKAALKAGYLGPDLSKIRDELSAALQRHSMKPLDEWWAPEHQADPDQLKKLEQAWRVLAAIRELKAEERQAQIALEGLSALLEGEYKMAIERLAPIAAGDPRLRFAQTIALIKSQRFEEALDLLKAMERQGQDPRLPLLRGLILRKLGRAGAAKALRAALD